MSDLDIQMEKLAWMAEIKNINNLECSICSWFPGVMLEIFQA
jgi:hypothetical protein